MRNRITIRGLRRWLPLSRKLSSGANPRRLIRPNTSWNWKDISERLDIIPAKFRVIVARRPKYACRSCEGRIVQAPAPVHTNAGGLPTEATLAHGIVSKYAIHLPLYRQAQICSRQGIDLDRSTLAAWVGKSAFKLTPVYETLMADLKRSTKLLHG